MLMKVNFVSFGTENCEDLLERFYAGLLRSCKEDFVLHYYAIGYNSKVAGERLSIRRLDPEIHREVPLFYKPIVLVRSLIDLDSEHFIYLDLDIWVTSKFCAKTLIDMSRVSKTPLSPNHFWERPFLFFNDVRIERGDKICEVKSITRCNKYVQNCLIAYTKNHFQFLTYWAGLSQDEEAISICHDDEELYNSVLWKYGQTETLGYICVTNGTVDVDGLGRFGSIERSYEKFEAGEFERDMFTDRNNFYGGFDPEKAMIFHGIK